MRKSILHAQGITLLLILLTAAVYVFFAYYLERRDFVLLISFYAAAFLLTGSLFKLKKNDFWFLAGAAVFFRLIFIAALPNLSQDFYRFIWDGRMILEGWNPYLYLPRDLMASGEVPVEQAKELYEGMGRLSANNHTNYPPLNQLIFALASLLGGKSILGPVIVMRAIIIIADLGILYYGHKLLKDLGLAKNRIFWYILNPFVILEFTGNLHFEGVMLFFLILSLYFLRKNKFVISALVFAASILLKLLPLLLLPLFVRYFTSFKQPSQTELKEQKTDADLRPWLRNKGLFRLVGYYSLVMLIVLIGFLPFVSEAFVSKFVGSIGLWFVKFEFNASIYNLIRWIGFQVKGYNIIDTVGRILPVIVMLIIAALAFFRKNNTQGKLITTLLLGISAYFFLSTTVHPWYIATPLLLSVFTPYRFVLVWSFTVMLSYFTYRTTDFEENALILCLEYLPVFALFCYEVYRYEFKANLPVIDGMT